jgi:hypothetical protein
VINLLSADRTPVNTKQPPLTTVHKGVKYKVYKMFVPKPVNNLDFADYIFLQAG